MSTLAEGRDFALGLGGEVDEALRGGHVHALLRVAGHGRVLQDQL